MTANSLIPQWLGECIRNINSGKRSPSQNPKRDRGGAPRRAGPRAARARTRKMAAPPGLRMAAATRI
jgi:hypothetical protein